MDPVVELIQACYDDNLPIVRRLHPSTGGKAGETVMLEAAIRGNARAVFPYLLDKSLVQQAAVILIVNLNRVDLLRQLMQRSPDFFSSSRMQSILTDLLTIAIGLGSLDLLKVLEQYCQPSRLAGLGQLIGLAASARQRAIVEYLLSRAIMSDAELIEAYPDLVLRRVQADPEPGRLARQVLDHVDTVPSSRPGLIVVCLNLWAGSKFRTVGPPNLDTLTVHRHLNTREGYWALQRLHPEHRSRLPGARWHVELTHRVRSRLEQLVGPTLLSYLYQRV